MGSPIAEKSISGLSGILTQVDWLITKPNEFDPITENDSISSWSGIWTKLGNKPVG